MYRLKRRRGRRDRKAGVVQVWPEGIPIRGLGVQHEGSRMWSKVGGVRWVAAGAHKVARGRGGTGTRSWSPPLQQFQWHVRQMRKDAGGGTDPFLSTGAVAALLAAVGMGWSCMPRGFTEGSVAQCLDREETKRVDKGDMERCLEDLKALKLESRLATDLGARDAHSSDFSFHTSALPDAVVWPVSAEEVSRILQICNTHKIPVVPYAAGTSLEGHILPIRGGITLDFSMMDKILAVNTTDMDVTVQPGVSYLELNEELAEHGLFFPPDPGAGACIGGMVGTGAAGTNAVLHGSMRENVLSLQVVLPNGEIVKTRQRSRKSSAGYDLTHLFIGSEGTLGVVTEATLKLKPLPRATAVATCSFDSIESATKCVEATARASVPVARMELLDDLMIKAVCKSTGLALEEKPLLMVEFASDSKTTLPEHIAQVEQFAKENDGGTFKFATEDEEIEDLWRARKEAYWSAYVLRPNSEIWTTDVCVPVSRLSEIMVKTKEDICSSQLVAPIVAHAGDGNFHVFLLIDPSNTEELKVADQFNRRLVLRAISMGGTCTGEHGIGEGKIDFLEVEHGKAAVDLMRKIKRALDPNDIMNPGKVIRQEEATKVKAGMTSGLSQSAC